VYADALAGLTVAVMHVPQGMAYGVLAGVDAIQGLYTSFWPQLVYMFFGTSRHVSLGTFAVISMMTAQVRYAYAPDDDTLLTSATNVTSVLQLDSVVKYTPIDVVVTLTFTVGLVQLLMGVLRVGFIATYLYANVRSNFVDLLYLYLLCTYTHPTISRSTRIGPINTRLHNRRRNARVHRTTAGRTGRVGAAACGSRLFVFHVCRSIQNDAQRQRCVYNHFGSGYRVIIRL
jgi:hypothetical protein